MAGEKENMGLSAVGGRPTEINVKINVEIDFETGRKIAEAIAEYHNREIKAFWDNLDGDHYPELENESTDINEMAIEWDKKIKELQCDIVININDDYLFYC